jgi:flagellar hook-associated protein 1 FlgK
MSIGAVFDIARTALATHQYAMDVTGHNIANVNTEGYSRQRVMSTSAGSDLRRGLLIGRGVDPGTVLRTVDPFINDQLMSQESKLAAAEEMEIYLRNLEAYFNDSGETGLSGMIADFWNYWHDLANHPSGSAERTALYEHALSLTEKVREVADQVARMEIELNRSVASGVDRINQIVDQIAQLNVQIVRIETNGSANDLRDQRETLLTELSRHIDVKSFEEETGSVTVVSAKGAILVDGNRANRLSMGGEDGDLIIWNGSGTNTMDITDHIAEGKLAGWLETRDEVLAQTLKNLDEFADALIWQVNRCHSQGVGLKLFEPGTPVSGTYATPDASGFLKDLHFGDHLDFSADEKTKMTIWIEDRIDSANPVMKPPVIIDLSSLNRDSLNRDATLQDLADTINGQIDASGLSGVSAEVSGTSLAFKGDINHAFGFSDDHSGILAALGINTFFTGSSAAGIGVNPVLADRDYIAAGRIGDGGYAVSNNENAMAMTDLQHASWSISRWSCQRVGDDVEGQTTASLEEYYHSLVGDIGIRVAGIARERSFKSELVAQVSEMRETISGVSLDEEMANLISLQHAYSAAAKLMATADEMIQELLELK